MTNLQLHIDKETENNSEKNDFIFYFQKRTRNQKTDFHLHCKN